jgi:hypothetical protein
VSENKVYVYSVSEDKDVSLMGDSVELALRISGVVGPAADWDASSYKHYLEIYRWGTMNIIRKYSGTGPETGVGAIQDVAWNTHNGYLKQDIV